MSVVLCIGGLDPSGRAGLLADARAVEAMGARAVCVASALTFQSSLSARGYVAVSPDVLRRQLELLLAEEPIGAVKLGQLASLENALLVAKLLPQRPLVVDTPLVTSSGVELLPAEAVSEAYAPLLARATLVTPNAVEVLALAGGHDPLAAVRRLEAAAVLLKGGHLVGDEVIDRLYERGELSRSWTASREPGVFRGTGCRLASAVAARLAEGDQLDLAIEAARGWLLGRLRSEARS